MGREMWGGRCGEGDVGREMRGGRGKMEPTPAKSFYSLYHDGQGVLRFSEAHWPPGGREIVSLPRLKFGDHVNVTLFCIFGGLDGG